MTLSHATYQHFHSEVDDELPHDAGEVPERVQGQTIGVAVTTVCLCVGVCQVSIL